VCFYFVAVCVYFKPVAFQAIGCFSILTCLFQGLVLMVFKSTICRLGCSLDTGGKCAIAAMVFWFLTGLTSFGSGQDAK
jgi:hypothetical protein